MLQNCTCTISESQEARYQIVQQLTAIAAIGRGGAGAAIAKAQLTKADLEVAKKEKKELPHKSSETIKKKAKRYATGK